MNPLDTQFHRMLAVKIRDERARVVEAIINIGVGDAMFVAQQFERLRGTISGFDEVLKLCEDVEREMIGGMSESTDLRGKPRRQ